MTQLVVNAVQWNSFAHIADVAPIGDDDAPCLEEIRSVLARHNKLDRFGVSLLHNHFPLSEDEILLETTDLDTREQRVRPVQRKELIANGVTAMTTVVTFDESGYQQACLCDLRTTGHYHK